MRFWASALIGALLASAGACSSVELRGAESVQRGHEPGKLIQSYLPRECQDASGAAFERRTVLHLVERDAKRVLVESRPGYDSFVIENERIEKNERVYQYILRSEGLRTLYDFRLPGNTSGSGRMAVTRRYSEHELPDGGFRADPAGPDLTCKLVPQAEVQSGEYSETQPETAPASAPQAKGTPEPAASYTVGDRVAVASGDGWVPALVKQSVGGRYFVEFAAGGGEWVEPSRIVGRLR